MITIIADPRPVGPARDRFPEEDWGSAPLDLGAFFGVWRRSAEQRAWLTLGSALSMGMLYAAGTAAIAPLVHWLLKPDKGASTLALYLPLLVLFLVRPFVAVAHTRAIGALVAGLPDAASRPVRPKLIAGLIIVSRDVPMALLLFASMAVLQGWFGLIFGLVLLSGLPVVILLDRKLSALPRDAAGRRLARTCREVASELPLSILIIALVVAKLTGHPPAIGATASLAACALLLRGPLRRIARLLEQTP